jgi:alkanesulfonate monooxygenase SsuD/methylene tetrahydromethanopterin reductase-like flavin-dependent oxidoreductase (luciferase family)
VDGTLIVSTPTPGERPAATGVALPSIGLWYDLRNPAPRSRTFTETYAATLEQIRWAERLGIGSAWFTEHHFAPDGYCPSPLVVAAAAAAATSTMRLGTNLVLLPLHDPVRIAEDATAVSLLSGGRFDLGVGLGYRQLEYDAFGRSIRHRPSLMEEAVAIIRSAWSGEEIDLEGKRFRLHGVAVTPSPDVAPRLLMGGLAEPAIRRAAKLADGFLSTQDATIDTFERACGELGRRDDPPVFSAQWAVVADDPDREWARVGDHALYQMNTYIEWGAFGPPELIPRFEDREQLRASGFYHAWDPDEAARHITELCRRHPRVADVHFWAQLPGEHVDSGSARIEVLATKVLPRVRAIIGAAA